MNALLLKRLRTSDQGTFGELYMDDTRLCVTCELPWKNNQHGVSCIPTGQYHYIPHNSPKHPDTWEIAAVPNRSAILIHEGNTIADTDGCILVGDRFGMIDDMPAVLDSKLTLHSLFGLIPEYGPIEITEAYETAS